MSFPDGGAGCDLGEKLGQPPLVLANAAGTA